MIRCKTMRLNKPISSVNFLVSLQALNNCFRVKRYLTRGLGHLLKAAWEDVLNCLASQQGIDRREVWPLVLISTQRGGKMAEQSKKEILKDKVVALVKDFIQTEGGITQDDLEILFGNPYNPIKAKDYMRFGIAAALSEIPISFSELDRLSP